MDTDLVLLEQFIKKHPLQAGQTIEGLEEEAIAAFVEDIPVELAVDLISLMNIYKVAKCLKLIKTDLAIELLEKSELQKAELFLRQLDADFRSKMLDQLSPKLAAVLRPKLEYPAYSVGALMVPLNFLLRNDMIVKDAKKALKREKDKISPTVFVVNNDGTLLGLIRSHDLLVAKETDKISAILKTETSRFLADMPVESIKNHPGWYENRVIPVVDRADKLIGAIHFEAIQNTTVEPGQEMNLRVMETSTALGELYRIGLTAFLQSVSK